jgi:hypothetical protein
MEKLTKNCLIYHHCCLGDLIYTYSVAQKLIDDGYTVYWPVTANHELLNEYLKMDGLVWCPEDGNYPMAEFYKQKESIDFPNGDKYLALMPEADAIKMPTYSMSSRHFWAKEKLGIEFGDFRRKVNINRNLKREKSLIEEYNLKGDYILVNDIFSFTHKVKIEVQSDLPIHYMYVEKDIQNGFHIFDWILAMQNAKEVHVVHSAFAYLVDRYCNRNKIYLYERQIMNDPNSGYDYHQSIGWVFRNPNWILR